MCIFILGSNFDAIHHKANLKNLLDTTSNIVVFRPDNVGVHDAGGRIQRVHSRIDSKLSNGTGQHSCRIQVSESCGWCRIGQVISRHIDGL